jgi:predicted glutamine amidotransferase
MTAERMCRWVGYFGSPLRMEELVYNTTHSLIEQSRSARLTTHITNADGFGLGWYGTRPVPGIYRSVAPAWNDRNLQELCAQIESPLFLAHIRASTGTPVQQTNCHPFRHERWLFVHNGFIDQYARLRRDLVLAVDPQLFDRIEGTTDSELLFFLAVTFGLDDGPLTALERMAGFVEATGRRHGVDEPLQMTVGVSDGERLYAVRYASGQVVANSLYVSNAARDVRLLYPEHEGLQRMSDDARAIVSEPLADLPGLWREVPPSSALIVQPGADEEVAFAPRAPE